MKPISTCSDRANPILFSDTQCTLSNIKFTVLTYLQFDLNALTEQREDPSVMLQFTPILHKQPIQILTKRMRENNRITEEQETKII